MGKMTEILDLEFKVDLALGRIESFSEVLLAADNDNNLVHPSHVAGVLEFLVESAKSEFENLKDEIRKRFPKEEEKEADPIAEEGVLLMGIVAEAIKAARANGGNLRKHLVAALTGEEEPQAEQSAAPAENSPDTLEAIQRLEDAFENSLVKFKCFDEAILCRHGKNDTEAANMSIIIESLWKAAYKDFFEVSSKLKEKAKQR